MVTNANPAVVLPNINNVMPAEFYGMAKDSKPVQNIPNGSVFIEMDTGKVYFYSISNHMWLDITKGEV